ncbi:unnamed protein product [Darwinula stevensoni]|uniref:Tetraspanin n=1 Tax=Darwinula stevensoni TaxID=69355 RepID=A0A7R8X133_9CRUS|nr:unnamed protein product [Darwinula stevensoni]CAG0881838.1 unnamed protein product [Darwinula stevensoni]
MGKFDARNVPACPKYLLFVFNLIVLIGGLVLTIIGIVAVANEDYFKGEEFVDHDMFRAGAIVIIVVGVITVFFSFFGCCGAIKESKCLLMTYAVLTTLALIGIGTVAILGFVFKADIVQEMKVALEDKMKNYNDKLNKEAWDNLQQNCENPSVENGNIYTSGCMDIVYKLEKYAGTLAIVALVFAILMILGVILACIVGCAA